jgi:hypothetical protein
MGAITRLAAMPGKKQLAGALAVVAAAVAISACGSSDSKTIPPDDAAKLTSALTAVQTAINNRDCAEAEARAHDFVVAVNELPDTVGAEDKDALRGAGVNLEKLAKDRSQCKTPPPVTGASGETGPQTTTTSTVPTTTDTESTTTTTSTTSTTTTSEPPPGNSGGGGDTGGPPSDTGGGGNTGGGGDTGGGGGGGTGGGSGGTGGTGTGGTGGTG